MSDDNAVRQSIRERAIALDYADEYAYAQAVINDEATDIDDMSDAEYSMFLELNELNTVRENALMHEAQRSYLRDVVIVPLALRLQSAPMAPERFYGPFANGAEALEWIDKQEQKGLSFSIIPLRSPHRSRPTSEYWYFDGMDSPEDFVAEVSIPQ